LTDGTLDKTGVALFRRGGTLDRTGGTQERTGGTVDRTFTPVAVPPSNAGKLCIPFSGLPEEQVRKGRFGGGWKVP